MHQFTVCPLAWVYRLKDILEYDKKSILNETDITQTLLKISNFLNFLQFSLDTGVNY